MKTLVAYFSPTGRTKSVANKIAHKANGDLFEIKPLIPYTSEDLDWTNSKSRSSVEMKDKSSRPQIAEKVENIDEYDTVFIGFPIWWYVAPTIINTFIESYDFSGKTIIPFATSGGSGLGRTEDILKSLCSDKANWLSGRLLNNVSDKDIEKWIKTLF